VIVLISFILSALNDNVENVVADSTHGPLITSEASRTHTIKACARDASKEHGRGTEKVKTQARNI
jgi:hypothetical protein